MHPRAEEFSERVRGEYGIEIDVHEFPGGTKTAADAAEAFGCSVEQIGSGIVLSADDDLLVSVTSGANCVSEAKIPECIGVDLTAVSMADPDEIKGTFGWSIGGNPPFGHGTAVPVFVDVALTAFDDVWAAAGTPKAVFPIAPSTLEEFADAMVADVREWL